MSILSPLLGWRPRLRSARVGVPRHRHFCADAVRRYEQAPICQAASRRTSEPSTRSLKTGRTSWRLRALIASRQVFPSASIRRVTYALAGGWKRDWVTAMTCSSAVELAVAAPVETHPLDLSRTGRDRRHAGQGREGVGGTEAAHVAGLGDEPGDGDWPRSRQRQERMTLDEGLDPTSERARTPARERGEAVEKTAREFPLDRCVAPQETPGHRPMTSGDEVRDRPAVAWHEDPQMGVQPVSRAGRLANKVFSGLEQEPDLARPIGQPDRRQVGLAGGDTSNREGVARIALARTARPPPLEPAEVRRHLADAKPGGETARARGAPNEDEPSTPIVAPGAIERAQAMNAACPAGSLENVSSPMARPSPSMAHAASVALWVSIPIAVIVCPPFAQDGCGSDGQQCVEGDTLLLSHVRLARPRRRGHLQIEPELEPGFIVSSHPPPRSNHRTARWRVERDAQITGLLAVSRPGCSESACEAPCRLAGG